MSTVMKKNQTAGKTAKTIWGIVASVGLTTMLTVSGSFIITAVSLAAFAFGAWKGGWMI